MRMFIVLLACAISVPAMADVFQWTDENGHMQMSDHPPPGNAHVKVLKKNGLEMPVSTQSSQEAADVRKRQDDALATLKGKQADSQEEKKAAADKAGSEAAACGQLKGQLAVLNRGRVVSFDSSGQRQYLSDDEIQQKKQENTEQMQENHCD